MLTARRQAILKFVIDKYITGATPVPSQSVVDECNLNVSPATIRNEMAFLEHEGYLIKPHTSAGSIPSDKGYRYYVESLKEANLALNDRMFFDHLFHQVEDELDAWLSLAATLLSQATRNVAVVTVPRSPGSRFKHVELVSIQDKLALIVLVLHGAKVKQQLVVLPELVSQPELAEITARLNALYDGLDREKILGKKPDLQPIEQIVNDAIIKMMQAENERDTEQPYLEGWHYMLNQPEFTHTDRVLALMELAESRRLLNTLLPHGVPQHTQVLIGKENESELVRDYSLVVSRYGIPDEAMGAIGVLGPTRMAYARSVSMVHYMATILSNLVAELHGRKIDQDKYKSGEIYQ